MRLTLAQAEEVYKALKPNLLLIGIKPDGYRAFPSTYEIVVKAITEDDSADLIKQCTHFKIYNLGSPVFKGWVDELLKKKADEKAMEEEKKDRELYENLKKRFEPS